MADQHPTDNQPFDVSNQLTCPICSSPLFHSQRQLVCDNKHSFDIAKQGYVNLLPVQHKRSKTPGDDKAMVLARQAFLNAGFYQPLAKKLAELLIQFSPSLNATHNEQDYRLMDAGCGEGYYLNKIITEIQAQRSKQSFGSSCTFYGIDISKPAIIEATKRRKDVHWLVASLKNIPIATRCLDGIVSVFSPIIATEFYNKLKPQGIVIQVGPGKDHLNSLKSHLYDEIKPFDEDKALKSMGDNWQLLHKEKLHSQFELNQPEQIQALLSMTPHTWRISPEKKARVSKLNELSCEADFLITLWQKKHDE
ncbi:MAG: methyltransferase domain-containing protein [Pseudomonadales bacterium]|nr:methyltransferase domain-containing protein [Pseudomonadales bacterium]